jgi:hypothetical protein
MAADEEMYEVPGWRLRELSRPVALTELPVVGKAVRCQLSATTGSHPARRFVWHHILPQACGGKTEPANLASLCDNDHYAVHDLMWRLAQGAAPAGIPKPWTRAQLALALQGYRAAVAAGTVSRMPKEA